VCVCVCGGLGILLSFFEPFFILKPQIETAKPL
jgi:hypothetical protein